MTVSSRPLLDVVQVHKAFGGVEAVADCSFNVVEGEICGLIGPNGAGKSTAVGLIGGALRGDRGQVWFAEQDVTSWPAHRRARAGLLRTFQLSQEWPNLTVIENVLLAAPEQVGETLWSALSARRRMRRQEEENWGRAEHLLAVFGLTALRDQLAWTLSGGQKRLLELARIAMGRAKLALLDEPMAGVSPALRSSIISQIRDMQASGISFLLVEHDLGVVGELCSRVIVMAAGRVLTEGTLDEIRRHPEVAAAYLGVSR
jgi:ABC-type branched-subunit amino acid transport system ATPase component